MKKVSFEIPKAFNHVFVECTEKGPVFYRDKFLTDIIVDNGENNEIDTMLPDNVTKIEMSKVFSDFDTVADTINYFHLWPFSHMRHAEIIADGISDFTFPLFNNTTKTCFRESMEKTKWLKSLFVIYTKDNNEKIGFLLFK
ncbi:MAG: hypothetical protein E7311_03110 [Clostridiales bacterium]|nr:hypothetical protein [Clostridiales bacterium]